MRKRFVMVLVGSMILGSLMGGTSLYAKNASSNLILNGAFEVDTDFWSNYNMIGGESTIAADEGVLKVDIKNSGMMPYSVQVY